MLRADERGWGGIHTGERERERRGGCKGESKPKRGECFPLPLATVGGVRLQPVVFLSLTHTRRHTPLVNSFTSLCSSACRTPGSLFASFSQMLLRLRPARWKLLFKDKEREKEATRKKERGRENQDKEEKRSDWRREDGAPQCSRPAPALLDRHPLQQYVSLRPSLYSSPLITSSLSARSASLQAILPPPPPYPPSCAACLRYMNTVWSLCIFSGLPIRSIIVAVY